MILCLIFNSAWVGNWDMYYDEKPVTYEQAVQKCKDIGGAWKLVELPTEQDRSDVSFSSFSISSCFPRMVFIFLDI